MEIDPGIHRVAVGDSAGADAPETNVYLVRGAESVAFIDSGFPEPQRAEPLLRYWREALDGAPVSWVLVSHLHHEHAGGVKLLKEATGARVAAGAGDAPVIDAEFGGGSSVVDRALVGGETFGLGGRTVRAVASPGHTAGTVCYLLEETGALFTGDHVMGQGTVVVRTDQGGSMADHIASLKALKGIGATRILSGHGAPIDGVDAKVDELVRHREQREEQFVALLREGVRSIDDMLARLYADTPERLLTLARHQAVAHLEKLRDEGRAAVIEEGVSYRPA